MLVFMLVLCKAIQILESRKLSVEAKTLLDLWNQKSLKNLEFEYTEGGIVDLKCWIKNPWLPCISLCGETIYGPGTGNNGLS